MKKSIILFAAAAALTPLVAGCAKNVDYYSYASEIRSEIYLYEDDTTSVKIQCSEREHPYASDGIKGEMSELVEIFVTLPENPQKLGIKTDGFEGEMNYRAAENEYYLSYGGKAFSKASVDVTLDIDGEEKSFSALTVRYDGVLTCSEALNCAIDYDKNLFESMTSNRIFNGEIFIRLLYDEGCYYYVGVCDRDKLITAFLVDGEKGKVITTKSIQG